MDRRSSCTHAHPTTLRSAPPIPLVTGVATLLALGLLASCQGSGGPLQNPGTGQPAPAGSLLDPLPPGFAAPGESGVGSLGLLAGRIDFDAGAIETQLPRLGLALGDTYDLDATDFFTRQPCRDCVQVTAVRKGAADTLEIDVRLRHPFGVDSGRFDLAVFDVRGILILPGTTEFRGITADVDGDGTIGSEEFVQGNVSLVTNADGYTTRFDGRAEDAAIFGAPKNIAGNLNPFLRYFDDPRATAFDPSAPAGHNVLGLGMDATRTWVLQVPPGGGTMPFVFVVDAAYGQAGSASDPQYRLPEFHRKEPWRVEAAILSNDLKGGDKGSTALIEVRVADWQQGATVADSWPASDPAHIRAASEVKRVMVTVPGVTTLVQAQTAASGSGTAADPLVFPLTITNTQGASAGSYTALIAARDDLATAGADPRPLPPGLTRGTPIDIRDYTTYTTLTLPVAESNATAAASLPNPVLYVSQAPQPSSWGIVNVVGNFGWVNDGGQGVGNLWRLDPDGTRTNLTNFFRAVIRKPVLNYNATLVAFSAKIGGGDANFQIYTMHPDGTGLTNLSRNSFNDFDPDFLPDGRLVFSSDRDGWRDPYNEGLAPQLYLMSASGHQQQRLTYSASGDYWPVVLKDGRISFRRWDNLRVNSEKEYMPTLDLPYGFPANFWMSDVNGSPLWVVNPDGTVPDLYYGSHLTRSRRTFMDHSELPDGKLLAIATPFSRTYGAGVISVLDPAEYDNVEIPSYRTEPEAAQDGPSPAGRYRTPIRIADNRFVASYSPGTVYDDGSHTDDPDFRLVVVDSFGTRRTLVNEPGVWEWMPLELKARPSPATLPVVADNTKNWGILAAANVFLRDAREPESKDPQPIPFPAPGFKVRFFAGILTTDHGLHSPFDATNIVRPHEYLGEAPVQSDGSFAAMLPADRPITWQVVNASGQVMVTERFYTNLGRGELRFCQGCHAPQRPGAFQEKTYQQTLASGQVTDLRP